MTGSVDRISSNRFISYGMATAFQGLLHSIPHLTFGSRWGDESNGGMLMIGLGFLFPVSCSSHDTSIGIWHVPVDGVC